MTKLDVSDNKIGDNGIAHIATALQTNTTITELNISRCSMSGEGVKSLARAIAVNRSLQELNISHSKIGDSGIAHIATALHTNITMICLVISHCNMSDEGAESLARALAMNTSLQELDISGNKIGDNGIASIATALHTNTTMRKLDISRCTMFDVVAESHALARALGVNSSLQTLHFYNNDLSENAIADIATALQTNNSLKMIMIGSEATTTDEGVLSLAAALTANSCNGALVAKLVIHTSRQHTKEDWRVCQ